MTIVLPPELCCLIVDAIPIESDDGRKALCKCLLVSRLFFRCSRARIFSFLHICPREIEEMAKLRGLLEYDEGLSDIEVPIGGYPPLKDCVKSLHISVWDGSFDQHLTEEAPATHDAVSILRILTESTKIQELHVQSNIFVQRQRAAPYYRAIKKICQSSHLVKLKVSSDLRFEEVFDIWKIKELDLRRTSVYEDPDNGATTHRAHDGTTPQLEVFSYILGRHMPSRWLKEPSPLSNLRELEMIVTRDSYNQSLDNDVPSLNKISAIAAATLKTLHIYIHGESYDPAIHSPPNFKELRVLQSLHYSLSLTLGPQQTYQITRITENWKDLPSSLRIIVIKLYFPSPRDNPPDAIGFAFFREIAWMGLGNMLLDNLFTKNDDLTVTIEILMEKPPIDANSEHVRVYRQFEEFPEIWRSRFPSIEIVSCPDSRDPHYF